MSQTTPPFDPEVQALLEEIVADPSSTLLRVPQERLSKWLTAREPPVSPREPLLTRAERHLLQAHRDYVAKLLLEGCILELIKGPIWKTKIHTWVTVKETPAPREDQWRARVTREVRDPSISSAVQDDGRWLRRCLGEGPFPPASELAAASLRMVANDEARIWLGVALHREGQSKSALRALTDVVSHRPSAPNERHARMDCGLVHFELGDFVQAVDWYSSAAMVDDASPIPLFSWMVSALQLGDERQSLAAAIRIHETVNANHPALMEFLELLRSVSPTPKCGRFLRRVHDEVPSAARAITDALQASIP